MQRLRGGGSSLTANCGYGRGYSVLDVIDAVKRITGRDFEVRLKGRRPGDAVSVVADAALARREFGWQPKLDDLDRIVGDAAAWEAALARRNT